MFVIISIEDKFDSLYNELREKGYEVYRFSEGKVSDVIIYSGKTTHINSLTMAERYGDSEGAFLINGDNLGGAQVQDIIMSRSYSSIF
jgi:hypothetical protein